jgi:tetratricopeptide (TPR) repeat protein
MSDGRHNSADSGHPPERARPDWSKRFWMMAALSAWIVFLVMLVLTRTDIRSENPAEPDQGGAETAAAEGGAAPARGPQSSSLDVTEAATTLSNADVLERSGNYRGALQALEQLRQQASGAPAEAIEFRIGLCAEALGDNERAMQCYRQISRGASAPALRDACRLGQARVWAREGEFTAAAAELSALRLAPSSGLGRGRIAAAAAHLLGDALCRQVTAATTGALLADRGVIAPPIATDVNLLELSEEQGEPAAAPPPTREGFDIVSRSGSQPDDIELTGTMGTAPVRDVVERLTDAVGMTATWSQTATQLVLGSSRPIAVDGIDLATLLDLLLTPSGVLWQLDGEGVSVFAAHEVPERERRELELATARRALTAALDRFPDGGLASMSLFWLGNLAFLEQQWDAASLYYHRVLEQFPQCLGAADAWFNEAKVRLVRGESAAALQGFLHVTDAARGGESEPAAFLYSGRLLLEAGEPRRALPRLLRARMLARDTDARREATLLLCLSYLLDDNPHGANVVLMEHRWDLDQDGAHDVAALLASLARHRGMTDPRLRQREAPVLLAALSHVAPEDFFGRYGWWVIASAYRELGLEERARKTFEEALRQTEPVAFDRRIRYELACQWDAAGRTETARSMLEELAAGSDLAWSRRAQLHLGEISLRAGDLPAALDFARQAASNDDDPDCQIDALKLLGRVYQRSGDHAAAAICFAGALPDAAHGGSAE